MSRYPAKQDQQGCALRFFAWRGMNTLWRVLICGWLAFGAGCALVPYFSGDVSMTAAQLTERIAKRFPVERSMAGLVDAKFSDPFVTLDESRNRMAFDFKLEVKLALSGKARGERENFRPPGVRGMATRSSLREPKVEQLRFDELNDIMTAAVAKAASSLAKDALETKPLHVFKPEDFNRQGISFEPEKLLIRGDKLVLTLKR